MTESLMKINCPDCGVIFGISYGCFYASHVSKKQFYCPNSDSLTYGKMTDVSFKAYKGNNLSHFICPACFIEFGITKEAEVSAARHGTAFACTGGHLMTFKGQKLQLAGTKPVEEIRADDVDRETALARISLAFQKGELTQAEFDERMSAAMTASFMHEIEPLTQDLKARTGKNASTLTRRDSSAGKQPAKFFSKLLALPYGAVYTALIVLVWLILIVVTIMR